MVNKPHPLDPLQVLASIPPTDDIVEYAMRCVQTLSPEIDTALVEATRRHLKQLFGGSSIYVGNNRRGGYEKQDRLRRDEAIRRDHRRGDHVHLLTRRYGLSRATIHRILSTPEPSRNA